MKIRIEMDIDLLSGAYDVRFHNLSHPGEDVDVSQVTGIAHRVIDSVAMKHPPRGGDFGEEAPQWNKNELN